MPTHAHVARDKRRRPYWRSDGLLGKTFRDKQDEHILVIGKDQWSRQEIVDELHCGNFVAAANLTKIARKLDVASLEQLISRFTLEDLFQERGCGITTVYVLLCAQEAANKDPLKWVDREPDDLVTLTTEQHRARKRQEQTRKEARANKKRAARATAQTAVAS
jgi:hypothetical protein